MHLVMSNAPVIAALVDSLELLGASTTDDAASSACLFHARRLREVDGAEAESVVREVQRALDGPKSDISDSVDRGLRFMEALAEASTAARAALNFCIRARRPELAAVLGKSTSGGGAATRLPSSGDKGANMT
jgi:hypothetical protein